MGGRIRKTESAFSTIHTSTQRVDHDLRGLGVILPRRALRAPIGRLFNVMEPPRWLTPTGAVLSMMDGAKGRVSPEIGARRSFLRAAAAERGPRTAVPPGLRGIYVSWVRTTIAARHGRASDVHLGLHAFVLAHSLGLPSTRAPLSKTRPAWPGAWPGQAPRPSG